MIMRTEKKATESPSQQTKREGKTHAQLISSLGPRWVMVAPLPDTRKCLHTVDPTAMPHGCCACKSELQVIWGRHMGPK